MDFWSAHGIMFLIGLILWPRVLLIYFGLIPSLSIPPILSFMFVPRMFLASILTPMYWDTNSILIGIYWVIAIVLDVVGIIMKIAMQKKMMEQMASS